MQEKKLREYVVHKGYCDFVLRQLPYCTCGLDEALSTSETTDLERLVEWLKKKKEKAIVEKNLYLESEAGWDYTHGIEFDLVRTLGHIAEVFGVGGEE